MEKLKISLPIVVEGRYDKNKIASIADATIITTGGFSLFNNKEILALVKKLSCRGIILLTDSDGAGSVIRSHLMSALPKDKVYNIYIPQVAGKEGRKDRRSKEGFLGVEGIDADVLRKLLAPFADGGAPSRGGITKQDFFADGLSGGENSASRRDALAAAAGLPQGMTANALLEALNIICTFDEYKDMIKNVKA